MAEEKQATHIRLPERSAAVHGPEGEPGETPKPPQTSDPRTASQGPVLPSGARDPIKKNLE